VQYRAIIISKLCKISKLFGYAKTLITKYFLMNLHLRNHFLVSIEYLRNISAFFPFENVRNVIAVLVAFPKNVIAVHSSCMHDKMVLISIFSGSFQFRNVDIEPCGIYTILLRDTASNILMTLCRRVCKFAESFQMLWQ
jgi:hypothetical protein